MEHDCCQPKEAPRDFEQNKIQGGENKKMKNYFVPIVVGLVLLLSIVQAFQISALRNNSALQVTSTAAANNAQTGETYEQMMARMHPDQVKAQPVQQSADPSMVGGC